MGNFYSSGIFLFFFAKTIVSRTVESFLIFFHRLFFFGGGGDLFEYLVSVVYFILVYVHTVFGN